MSAVLAVSVSGVATVCVLIILIEVQLLQREPTGIGRRLDASSVFAFLLVSFPVLS